MRDAANATKTQLDTQEELAAVKDELRRARQELEQFSHFISHDFGAPLRHIVAFSGLLEKELVGHGDGDGDVATWLGFMSNAARLIQKLVDESLLFSRARRAIPEEGATHVAAMFAELQAAAPVPEEGVDVVNEIGADVVVAMSPHHATQVFAHLLANAIHYRKRGEAAHVQLSGRSVADGKAWALEIRDEGLGIHDDAVGRVFDAFYRSSESPVESPGLGLSLARHLITLYGGSIEIESEHGEFTRVHVVLPAA